MTHPAPVHPAAIIAARLKKARARRAVPCAGPTDTQRAQAWLRAARWWPAGSERRKDFVERARAILGRVEVGDGR